MVEAVGMVIKAAGSAVAGATTVAAPAAAVEVGVGAVAAAVETGVGAFAAEAVAPQVGKMAAIASRGSVAAEPIGAIRELAGASVEPAVALSPELLAPEVQQAIRSAVREAMSRLGPATQADLAAMSVDIQTNLAELMSTLPPSKKQVAMMLLAASVGDVAMQTAARPDK